MLDKTEELAKLHQIFLNLRSDRDYINEESMTLDNLDPTQKVEEGTQTTPRGPLPPGGGTDKVGLPRFVFPDTQPNLQGGPILIEEAFLKNSLI